MASRFLATNRITRIGAGFAWGKGASAVSSVVAPSVFAHGVTASNSLLLAWWNALVDRDLSTPTNIQFELFPDGRFAWRTDDASQVYLPVLPFDWDGDGIENSPTS